MTTTPLPAILGCGIIGDPADSSVNISTVEQAQAWLNVFRAHGHVTIDTARRYPSPAPGTSEKLLGQTDVASWATIDTKVFSNPGDHAPEKIRESITGSLADLKISQVHTNYCHFPDRNTPLEDMCQAMAAGIAGGQMKHWAISNYSIDEVEKIVAICKQHDYPLPVVYQGIYSALTRKMEDELLPILRKNNIAFYAYSPAAGGAFSKTSSRMSDDTPLGGFFRALFGKPDLNAAIEHIQDVAAEHGIDGHSAALRWVFYHSALKRENGDAVVIGASSPQQLEKTLTACEAGPLPAELAKAIEGVWEGAKEIAPDYSPFLVKSTPES